MFELNYERYVIMLPEVDQLTIKQYLEACLDEVREQFELDMLVSIGRSVSTFYEVSQSFNDALNIMEHRVLLDKKEIISSDDLADLENVTYYYPLDLERKILSYATAGQREQVQKLLKLLLDKNLHVYNLSSEGLTEFKFAIAATFKRLLQQLNKSVDSVFGEGSILYLELSACRTYEQLENKILSMFDQVILSVNNENSEKNNNTVELIKNYIEKHYQNDVSLDDIARHLGLSAGYISKLFKNHTNVNFKDYLNQYRIECAKEVLLRNPGIRMNELSKNMGFNNAVSFNRAFKRYEGVAPSEFIRRKNKYN